jgi:hypothetical protein
MEILIAAVVLALIFGQNGSKTTKNRSGGRRLSDEIHPLATIFMGIL